MAEQRWCAKALLTHEFAVVLACVVAFLSLIGLFVWGLEHGEQVRKDKRANTVHRVNHACDGNRPVSIKRHGSGWNNGAWFEARCANGTVVVVEY